MKIDTNHILNKVCSTACMMLCYVAFFSCVGIDMYEGESQQPRNIGSIELIYHWPEGMADGERPDSMLALINRAVMNHHIGYVTGSEISVGGRYLFGKVYDDGSFAVSEDDQQPLMATAGDYRVFVFSNNGAKVKTDSVYRIENLDNIFGKGDEDAINIHNLYVSYVPVDSSSQVNYGKDWIDSNPYSKYITTDISPIYCTYNEYNEETELYTFSVKDNSKTEVHLYPQKVTQDITISFPVYVEYVNDLNFISVDGVIAEISGIPHRMNLYSGELDVDTTYKMLFKLDVDPVKTDTVLIVDSDSIARKFKKVECAKTISVTGLLANEGPEYTTGAGILQLCASVKDSTITKYSEILEGVEKVKDTIIVKSAKVMVKVNMYETINAANLVIRDEDGLIKQNTNELYPELPYNSTLRMDSKPLLVITREDMEKANNGENIWLGDSDYDGELDDDHKLELEM